MAEYMGEIAIIIVNLEKADAVLSAYCAQGAGQSLGPGNL